MIKDKLIKEIIGIFLLLFAVILFLSIASFDINDYHRIVANNPVNNLIGPIGALFSHFFRSAFGMAAYFVFLLFALMGWTALKGKQFADVMSKLFAMFYMIIALSALIAIFSKGQVQLEGGYIGLYINKFLQAGLGKVGAYLTISLMNFVGLMLLGIVSISTLIELAGTRGEFSNKMQGLLGKLSFFKKAEINTATDLDEQTMTKKTIDPKKTKKKKMPWITKEIVYVPNKSNKPKINQNLLLPIPENFPSGDGLIVKDALKMPPYEKNQFEKLYQQQYSEFADSLAKAPEERYPVAEETNFDGITDEFPIENHSQKTKELESSYRIKSIEACDETEAYAFLKENRVPTIDVQVEDSGNIKQAIDDTDENYDDPADYGIENYKETGPVAEKPERSENEPLSKNIKPVIQATTDNALAEQKKVFAEIELTDDYIIPATFFKTSIPIDSESWKNEIRKNSVLLVNTLNNFGIESKVIHVHRGPVITLYELQIAPGIKVNKVVGLSDDIAMALAAYRVRIVAPIPGKSAIGVEIPNTDREYVTLGDIIDSDEYKKHRGSLKVALGKDILGKPITLDLKKLPHLLIAGATGSGKSVCVNTIITSLIYTYDPNQVRFIMVDPKMVELQLYNGLPHLLTPVITEPHVAPIVLKWAIYEMERRYRLLSVLNTRDIERYNQKVSADKKTKGEILPFIVIIIDELADLMMVASKEIEGYITRLAQKARAVGIHLVLATQRPSVDVITGIIKANFPARIAFQVAQKTDSRTIMDQNGAEKLLGKGDMLYLSAESSFPIRLQGAFISEDEIMQLVDHLSLYGDPQYIDIEASLQESDTDFGDDAGDQDELFVEALKIVEETRKASASYLQRRLSIGYNRAARIIEDMEDRGYIGPQQGSKPRDVFI